MKNFFKLLSSIFFILCIVSLSASAQNKKISLQGFLKDANGKAVADGIQSLTFKIYTDASGGPVLWSEDQSIPVVGGVYAVQLGKVVDISILTWKVPHFLGVTVQGVELIPRTELTYSPYSLSTQTVVCSGALGDVKYSILNPTQFASVNGDCWVPMDGRSMAGSTLATKIGGANVPNGSGLFIRSHEFEEGNDPSRSVGTAIASIQGDDNKQHSHTGSISTAGEHTHGHNANGGNMGISYIDRINTTTGVDNGQDEVNIKTLAGLNINAAGSHNHTVTVNDSGGSETRPKNIDFYVYIRIN